MHRQLCFINKSLFFFSIALCTGFLHFQHLGHPGIIKKVIWLCVVSQNSYHILFLCYVSGNMCPCHLRTSYLAVSQSEVWLFLPVSPLSYMAVHVGWFLKQQIALGWPTSLVSCKDGRWPAAKSKVTLHTRHRGSSIIRQFEGGRGNELCPCIIFTTYTTKCSQWKAFKVQL